MAADVVWWWATHAPDEGLPLASPSASSLPLDPLAAALEQLVDHLRCVVGDHLQAAYGASSSLVVLRGWPDDAGASKPSAPAILAVTAGPMTTTSVAAGRVATYRSGGDVVSTVVCAHWQATATVTLLCDHRSVRDKVAPWVHRALDVVSLAGPRGLRLESVRYHHRPVAYRLTGASHTDEGEAAMLGEWRSAWTLEARSDLVVTEAHPAIGEHRATPTHTT